MNRFLLAIVVAATTLESGCEAAFGSPLVVARTEPIVGPLHVSSENPRYFADATGRIVYLTGSHTWNNLQDAGPNDPPAPFDYDAYLRYLAQHGHNFFRLWNLEQARGSAGTIVPYWIAPLPYARTGPGDALDGKPKFDLTRFDEEYFARLRARVEQARQAGVYVSVMLFDGWSVEEKHPGRANPWLGHPFHRANNVNGVDGDPNRDDQGDETHALRVPAVTALQEAYVRKVVDTVGDLDNVLYEISNESGRGSTDWQYHMILYLKEYERSKGKQHPVGMTAQYPDGDNAVLFASPADWVSPNGSDQPMSDPPVADGRKVILDDTDHLCGICGSTEWAWESFLRGRNALLMDVYEGSFDLPNPIDPHGRELESLRRNLGYIRAYAGRVDLARTLPHPELCSTGYCLADPEAGRAAYLVYIPGGLRPTREGRVATLDLRHSPGPFAVEWFSPRFERVVQEDSIQGGAVVRFRAPFPVGDALLYLRQ